MNNPLRAAHYADGATWCQTGCVENVRIAEDTFRIRMACSELARRILPGQFVMLRLAGRQDPLLARPFALYDTYPEAGDPAGIDVVYLVKGKCTSQLADYRCGDELEVWGPLGNGFPPDAVEHLVMVAGGIGQTPFLALGAEFLGRKTYGSPARVVAAARRVTLCYGARRAAMLAGIEQFERLGIEVRIATDDGSRGHRGFVTDLVREIVSAPATAAERRIVCCGPEPMMHAVSEIALASQTRCHVSLETPMACGVGICFTCVAKVIGNDGTWDYKRTCVDGPVFECEKIVW